MSYLDQFHFKRRWGITCKPYSNNNQNCGTVFSQKFNWFVILLYFTET